MKEQEFIAKILGQEHFQTKPPVLLDIGASGAIHPEWKSIAPFSICLAFDADDRDFSANTAESGFKKLILVNSIVSDRNDAETDFYLTRSPHCSSTLAPLNKELSDWSFSELFVTERKIKLKNISLVAALKQNVIDHLDWFKTDSQGIDLRLFSSLPSPIQKNILIAEFEPGFIDAYEGEDKIPSMLSFMEKLPFWLSDCIVKGAQRISEKTREKYKLVGKELNIRNSACWAEFTYMNNYKDPKDQRDLWLMCVFCLVKKQYGFALDILVKLEDSNLKHELEKYLLEEVTKITVQPQSGLKNKIKNIFR